METIFFLESIYKKLIKQGNSFLENKSSYESDLINTVKSTKKKNMTPEITFQMILNCIPGISNKVSKRIASKFITPKNMIIELGNIDTRANKIEYIKNIKMSDDEKAKKISKTVAENIIINLGLDVEDIKQSDTIKE
tara:strand:- start:36 stop:446 length:411 start_codon:yes stop_codon:yes gene_type:complete